MSPGASVSASHHLCGYKPQLHGQTWDPHVCYGLFITLPLLLSLFSLVPQLLAQTGKSKTPISVQLVYDKLKPQK